MKYNVVIANPANNITVIVLDYIDKNQYIDISQNILKILSMEQNKLDL